jgi:hypothetical protein
VLFRSPANTAVSEPNMLKETDKKVAPGNTVVSEPNMLKEEEDEEEVPEDLETDSPEHEEAETPEEEKTEHMPGGEEFGEEPFQKHGDKPLEFAPAAQSLGVGTIKPDGAPTVGVDITIDPDKTVNIAMNEAKKALIKQIAEGVNKYMTEVSTGFARKAADTTNHATQQAPIAKSAMNESEVKLRKYIRNRLEEKAGLRKANLNESKKSPTLKKLDGVIDEQFKLYEGVVLKKKAKINEVFGFSVKEKFAKLQPNDKAAVENLFNQVFSQILTNPQLGAIGRVAKKTPTNVKYEILKQYVETGGGTLRVSDDKTMVQFAPQSLKNSATKSNFSSGGTMGHTDSGGV